MFTISEKKDRDFSERGRALSERLTKVVHDGHYRKVIVLNEDGHRLFEFPLLLGVVITLILPVLAGFMLLFFLMSGWHAETEKRKN